MFVLAVARIKIEINTADEFAARGVVHVEVHHIVVPHRHARFDEADSIQALADVEHPIDGCRRRKILAQRFLIDRVAALAQSFAVIRRIPSIDVRALDSDSFERRFHLAELREIFHLETGRQA